MEMQFVTFSDEFASLSEAVESGDGAALMVLGVFFELGNTDHPELEAMIQLMCVGTPFLLGGGGLRAEQALYAPRRRSECP